MTQQLAQALLSTQLSQVLSSAEASELAEAAMTRQVKRGASLFRAGDAGNALFVVLEGGFNVVLGAEVVVAQLGVGQLVGELEVMTRSLRVASLVATEDSTVMELPVAKLDALLAANKPSANKLVQVIAKSLARRLAAVNQRVAERAAAAVSAAPAPAPAPAAAAPAPLAPTSGARPGAPIAPPAGGKLGAPLPPPNAKPLAPIAPVAAAPAPKPPAPPAPQPMSETDSSVSDSEILDKLWS